jgi:hypothetical protein
MTTDDDGFYLFLQKQKLAQRCIPFSGISFALCVLQDCFVRDEKKKRRVSQVPLLSSLSLSLSCARSLSRWLSTATKQ